MLCDITGAAADAADAARVACGPAVTAFVSAGQIGRWIRATRFVQICNEKQKIVGFLG